MIEEGTFTIFDNSGKELARVSKGSCFGELALLHQVCLFIPCSSYWTTCRPHVHVHTRVLHRLLVMRTLHIVLSPDVEQHQQEGGVWSCRMCGQPM